MKLLGILACALLVAQTAVAQISVKVMSYNIHNGIGLDGVTDYQRTADVIAAQAPDVVALQEVDSVTTRSKGIDVLKELGSMTLMHATFSGAIPFQGGAYGHGILSKEKPLRTRKIALPGKEELRTALIVELEDYVVCNAHLSLTEADRMTSVEILKRELAKEVKPVILMGDFNAKPDSKEMIVLQEDFKSLSDTKQPTFPADKPNICIDYIFGRTAGGYTYTSLNKEIVADSITSDHRPLVAEVRLQVPTDKIFRTLPYLQNPVDGGITVTWLTNTKTNSWVEYGTDKSNLCRARTLVDGQAICNNYIHKIRLEGIEPGEKYYYRICSQEIILYRAYSKVFGNTATSPFYSFELPETDESDFTALIFNDLHQRTETIKALFENVKDVDYDFVVFNGDCIDDPLNEAQAVRSISAYNDIVGATEVPVFYLRGNHEIRNAYSIGLRGLFDYVNNKTYGAFSWGDTRVVMLDCGEDKPDDHWVYYGLNDFTQLRNDQVSFLREELKSKEFKKAERRLLIHHIPVYGNEGGYQPCYELWTPLLKKAKFDAAINGHTHRFKFHPKGSVENNFPVFVGGDYSLKDATLMLVEKKGETMTIKVLNAKGEILKALTIN